MTISGNLILSLGMVGALSIVRYRTPIKDPIDLVFIFWALTVGIANGVGYYNITLIGSLFITLTLLIFHYKKEQNEFYLIIIQSPKEEEIEQFLNFLKKNKIEYKIKSSTSTSTNKELILEIRTRKMNIIDLFSQKEKNIKITILSYDNEYEE